jgi:hypothetical protein
MDGHSRRALILLLLAACEKKTPAPAPPPPPAPTAAVDERACGDLSCRAYDSPEEAFKVVLEQKPDLLAIGEAHAPKGSEKIEPAARRFTKQMLPLLKDRASDLLVELMAPPEGCNKTTQDVKNTQKQVTDKQAPTNQSDYVVMGNEAKKLGVVPDLLRPTCADLAAIQDAGADAIAKSLETIARLTVDKSTKLLGRQGRSMIVLYGGAMHNDLEPAPERLAWSFSPQLKDKGKYIELDIFVREFIDGSDAWKKMEWYEAFSAAKDRFATKVMLLQPKPGGSYVLIFPAAA